MPKKRDKNIFRVNKRTSELMVGLSIILIIGVLYDLAVGDRNWARYIVLITAGLIIASAVFLRVVNKRKVRVIFDNQAGVR